MGAQEDNDQILSGKGANQINSMKAEAEELKEFYKKLKHTNDSHQKSIVGLTTEKEDVRLRIRALINKRVAAEGPDFDEYQITRRVSRQYEPINPQRRKSSSSRPAVSAAPVVASEIQAEITPEESEPNLPATVTVTIKT